MAKAKTSSIDSLIAAVIGKLPESGTDFPVERQKAWLKMMALALATVYGGEAVSFEEPAQARPTDPKPEAAPPPTQPKPRELDYPFMVDRAGFARNRKGKRILPAEVTDVLYDMRGEGGEPSGIVWADGSAGVPGGCDISISVVLPQ